MMKRRRKEGEDSGDDDDDDKKEKEDRRRRGRRSRKLMGNFVYFGEKKDVKQKRKPALKLVLHKGKTTIAAIRIYNVR